MCDNYVYTANGIYYKGSFLPKLKEHFTHCHYHVEKNLNQGIKQNNVILIVGLNLIV
jgi:hypothetical protein